MSTMRAQFAAALLGVTFSTPLAAQQAPPEPLPLGEVAFPAFDERTLSNGARLLVVPQHEVPFVTVNLVVPAGSVADPDGMEGVASMAAQLLTNGTASRTKEELAEAIDALGASLSAGASDEWTTVSLAAVTPALDRGLELMADAVLNPVFPDDELELLRTRTLSGLRVQLSQPASLASRAFTREVFGAHPYGRLETPETVQAIDRASIVGFHEALYRPGGALFVVAGDVEADDVARRIEEAFEGWSGEATLDSDHPAPPDRAQPEVLIVHRPGAVQTELRVGHLLPGGDVPDWTALSVANQVLGGGSSSRFFRVLREERGYTYGAGSSVARRRDRGTFLASMAVRTEVTGEAVEAMLGLVRELLDTPVPDDELQDTKDFLIGSFPLQIETPQQVAGQVTTNRLLGLDPDAITTFRERVAAVDAAALRDAARRYIDPQRLFIVAVGDATAIRPQLATLGHVRIEDVEGNPLTLADLEPQGASETFDASGLEPVSLRYGVMVQGTQVGTASRALVRSDDDGRWLFTSSVVAGPQEIDQRVVFTDAFEFVSSGSTIRAMGQELGFEARLEDGRIVGESRMPGQAGPIDMPAPDGVVVSDMVELVLWIADLEVGREIRLPLASPQGGTVENVTLSVEAREEVTVPAGTFDAFRVELSGVDAQTLWVRAEGPRFVVRVAAAAQPVVLELLELPGGGG